MVSSAILGPERSRAWLTRLAMVAKDEPVSGRPPRRASRAPWNWYSPYITPTYTPTDRPARSERR